jgi:hypothetical protein
MPHTPDIGDFKNLQNLLNQAIADIPKVVWELYYPLYPESIPKLMKCLSSPPWINPTLRSSDAIATIDQPESATLEEVRSAIKLAVRSERFCDGAWLKFLENGSLEALVKRAGEIISRKHRGD